MNVHKTGGEKHFIAVYELGKTDDMARNIAD